ncbi:MAG: N-methyl-L-tryptophan oxidase [Desulfocapsaceae bacterium]|nr:N-methyl-L-tryptophan oxidase [Desulfocapsaceae bacterium]
MQIFDYIVVGLGTAGSATCMTLARRGSKVFGIDTYRPPHTMGSHHGVTRSVRRAYLEGTSYVPMAMKSWELWRKLEVDSGRKLLVDTGNLTIGPSDCPAIDGFLRSAQVYDIPYVRMTAREIQKRWPQIRPADNFIGGLEKEAGIVFPDLCIRALLAEAEKAGATLLFNSSVEKMIEKDGAVTVYCNGESYVASRLLVAAGGWTAKLLDLPDSIIVPQRVPVHWFGVGNDQSYSLGKFPVNFWQIPVENDKGNHLKYRELYSLPTMAGGQKVKVAFHNGLESCNPDQLDRNVSENEVLEIKNMLSHYLPNLQHRPVSSEVCMYTMTADGDFYLGKKPGSRNIFAATLAGHGFKFAPVLGEILADLLTETNPEFDLQLFSPTRFTTAL